MDDATRPDAGSGDDHSPSAGSSDEVALVTEPAPDWVDVFCPIERRRRLRELLTEGEALLDLTERWAAATSVELVGYESAIKDRRLTETIAHDLSFLVGVGQIHDLIEAFANLAEPAGERGVGRHCR